ncbi:helix-turn-helix domain-containing protein [Paraburkholderia sp. RL17-373-BIF-A]|uniref:helix-turn-helix domain-containing protein n=1 Tax=Paraburkholderia sp. RL17-373-BIF-A TaxID=3031629 RepID=UPI0038B919C7
MVSNGYTCTEVGQLLGQAATTVQRWGRRFEQGGFDGLPEGERPGRPRALDESQWHRTEADLRRTPRDFEFEAGLWDGQPCPNICASATDQAGRSAVPETVQTDGFSAAQAAPAGCAV